MSASLPAFTVARILTSLLLFFTIWCAKVNYTFSDSQLTLLTSQAIAQHGSINLYRYKVSSTPEQFSNGIWKFTNRQRPETIYYSYPLGAAFLSVPVVAAANVFGLDMSIAAHDAWMQCLLAALSAVCIFLLTHRLLKLLTGEIIAFAVAVVFAFGTSYMSSVGTALWSFNYELIAVLLLLHLIAKAELNRDRLASPVLLATLVFLAWLCRPSAISVAALTSVWVFWRQRKTVYLYAGVLIAWFLVFVLISQSTFELFLPPYYNPFFWTHYSFPDSSISMRLSAMLWSPARGLFVFTPVLLFAFGGMFSATVRRNRFYLAALGWFVLQLVLAATQRNWWGGWCFGPRLLTDSLPPLAIMLTITIHHWQSEGRLRRFLPGLAVFGLFGVFVHTAQGMYNIHTLTWNNSPNIDDMPGYYIWNWSHSQVFAGETGNKIKQRELELGTELDPVMKLLNPGQHLLYGQPDQITRNIFDRWNKPGSIQLHNNLYTIEKSGADTFWITAKNTDQIKALDYYAIVKSPFTLSLGAWLKKHESQTVLLSVCDEASSSLSPESKTYLKSMGANPDSLKFRQGYTLHIQRGKLIAEKFENNDSAAYNYQQGTLQIALRSCGNQSGNFSSIKINGKENSLNFRGFNAVAIDANGKIISATRFDTYIQDMEDVKVMPVIRKADLK
ncbi:MAG: hypothetical protein MUC87_02985 [Bacteroidia bacterium]|jgi:hypothetical protein|nr:hypothetical protein [Bacteroidia bacterium]